MVSIYYLSNLVKMSLDGFFSRLDVCFEAQFYGFPMYSYFCRSLCTSFILPDIEP
jgi:hypothetical protein